MADQFLSLPIDARAELLAIQAAELGKSATVLEKDVWVCWALKQLFSMPGRQAMAFKGGTSLSKVYGAIQRFSEDIDVTIDWRSFKLDADPFALDASRTRQKKVGEALRAALKNLVAAKVAPFLEGQIDAQFSNGAISIEVDALGEKVAIRYPSAVKDRHGYVTDSVLLEFGARNVTEPNEQAEVRTFLAAAMIKDVEFPIASVDVLDARRTFWEKATLIHVKCNQNDAAGGTRFSRHWYDLAKLADHEIGRRAIASRDQLDDVVRTKKVFFQERDANYDACATGGLRLVPEEPLRTALAKDLEEMKAAAMFYEEPPTLPEILETLAKLAASVNNTAPAPSSS